MIKWEYTEVARTAESGHEQKEGISDIELYQ